MVITIAIFPNLSPIPELRAYHASEVPIVFGNLPPNSTAEQAALSKYIQGAWVAFARDSVKGLTNYGWPLYKVDTASIAVLGGFYNRTGVSFTNSTLVDPLCGNVTALAALRQQAESLMGSSAQYII
jgi:hypothetical protein